MSEPSPGIITISVEGVRTEPGVWHTVRALPGDQLPPLTPAQKEVAASLHIPEEDYSRSIEAGRRATAQLMKKTERFARLLQGRVEMRGPGILIESVDLNTWEHRFEVRFRIEDELETLRVAEDIVDGLFEEGSREAEERLSRVLDYGLSRVGRG